jgi:hypothetical protein
MAAIDAITTGRFNFMRALDLKFRFYDDRLVLQKSTL